jgi:hypothetical protein
LQPLAQDFVPAPEARVELDAGLFLLEPARVLVEGEEEGFCEGRC